ncbi:hypothetical protein [Paenarthrobacter nicotinovorans]|uniref:hypothetical protein n=1 Tax=Paenarthrobacter nicotinovorans TaxID=29320 RepID=UPI003D66B006
MAITSLALGIGLQVLSAHIHEMAALSWAGFLPLSEIGGTLFAAGLFGVAWDYFDGKDKEARTDERIRHLLEESAPSFRDAVVRGFAVENDDLRRVATPELLDSIAGNVLAMRLGDRAFAEEVYADIRDQAIRAPERWHDVDVDIRLSTVGENTKGAPRFVVTVKWEYTVVPSHEVQRFACVADRDEFRELVSDIPSTATWYMVPRPGFDASKRDAFELVQFAIDGVERPIRRTERKTGQTYSVNLGEERLAAAKPVRISYIYKTITPKAGHLLHFDIDQPTKGMSVTLDYSDSEISRVSVLDLIASTKHARIERMPISVPGKSVTLSFDGWVFPRTCIAFVCTLATEETQA